MKNFAKSASISLLLAVVLIATSSAHAQEEQNYSALRLGVGVDYTSGDYGTGQNTEIFSVPFTVKYETDPWTFRLMIPYVEVTGPGDVVGGTGGPVVIGSPTTRTTERGLGDIVSGISYAIMPANDAIPLIELTGKIKFPTADKSRNLGTGEFDYTIQSDVSKSFGPVTPFVSVGYRFLGDPPGIELRNILLASAGAGMKISRSFSGGLILDYKQASVSTSDDSLEFSPYVTWKPFARWALNLYGVIGLSDGSPDEGGGAQISYTW